jgi:MYXO-CTERM domain-containing protein
MALDSDALALWRLHVDWQTPDNSHLDGPVSIPVAPFSGGSLVPQPGTDNLLSVLSDRLMYRLAYRRFADHESLVVNHTVSTGGRNGVRWYEIRDPAGTPQVAQQGTFAPDDDWRWMGSANLDAAGNLAVGYSIANDSTRSPSIAVAARLATDPPGTLVQEAVLVEGTGVQTSSDRWGDYSSMSVDPTDDCTFWYTTEYLAHTGAQASWNTRVGSFRFANCTTVLPPFNGSIVPTPHGSPDAGGVGGAGGSGTGGSGGDGTPATMDGGCACATVHETPAPVGALLLLALLAYNRLAWKSSSSRRRMKTRHTFHRCAWRCWPRTRPPM